MIRTRWTQLHMYCRDILAQLRREEDGSNAVMIALLLTVLMGFGGLGIDGSNAFFQRQRMQIAADAAALGGTRLLALGADTETINMEVQNLATGNAASSATWTYINDGRGLSVTASRTFETYFAKLYGFPTFTVRAVSDAQFETVTGADNLFPLTISCDCLEGGQSSFVDDDPPDDEGNPTPETEDEIEGAGCELYPIALHYDTLFPPNGNNVQIDTVIEDIYNGSQPGNFGWLSWDGQNNSPALIASLTPPGNSHIFVNPYQATDDAVSIGDWVQGLPGVTNSSGVRDALDVLMTMDIAVPVWDSAELQGSNANYHVVGFAKVRITDYHLPNQNRISARYLGPACGSSFPEMEPAPESGGSGGDAVCLPTIDFETGDAGTALQPGQIIDDEWASWGVQVTTNSPNNHPAMIFNSSAPTGGDTDLGTPNSAFGGPGIGSGGAAGNPGANSQALGKILVIAEKQNGPPDDNAGGGTLIFTFEMGVSIDDVYIVDVDEEEASGVVKTYADSNGTSLLTTAKILGLGDNSVQAMRVDADNVRRLEIEFPSNGGVAAIVSCRSQTIQRYDIGNFIWADTDTDGIQDAVEMGVGGVKMELYISGMSHVAARTTTNSSGQYSFRDLPAGNYEVKIANSNFSLGAPLFGLSLSPTNAAGDDAKDSEFDTSTKRAVVSLPGSGASNESVDGGIQMPSIVSDPPPDVPVPVPTLTPTPESEDVAGGMVDTGVDQSCEFRWVDWDSDPSTNMELQQNIINPSNSGAWTLGSVMWAGPPVSNSSLIQEGLDIRLGDTFIIPLSEYDGTGYAICGFAEVEFLSHDLTDPANRWVSFQFLKDLLRSVASAPIEPDFGLRDVRILR